MKGESGANHFCYDKVLLNRTYLLSLFDSVCLYVYLFVTVCLCQAAFCSLCLFFSVCPSVSVCLCLALSGSLFLSICLSVSVSVCLGLSLSFSNCLRARTREFTPRV